MWNPEPSAATYDLYRDLLTTIPGSYGACYAPGVSVPTTTDSSSPLAQQAFIYLVTAVNLLGEEGIRGQDSAGSPRPAGPSCP